LGEALPPFDDGIGAGVAFARDDLNALACQTTQYHAGAFHGLFGFGPARSQSLQGFPVLRTAIDLRRSA
jgi:hypothetical protein